MSSCICCVKVSTFPRSLLLVNIGPDHQHLFNQASSWKHCAYVQRAFLGNDHVGNRMMTYVKTLVHVAYRTGAAMRIVTASHQLC